MSEPMKRPLTNITIDGKDYAIEREQKKAILSLLKTITHSSENPFEELEKSLPPYSISLRGARKRIDMTQKKLSKLTGIDLSNISKMENGERKIGEKVAKKLGKSLKVSYRVFL